MWGFVQSLADSFACSLQAANYLNIKSLLDLTCMTVADMIKGKLFTLLCQSKTQGVGMNLYP
jgi:Skp1 family, dimerisation domain